MGSNDSVESWQERLAAAEEDLAERARAVLPGEPTPEELRALAEERDKLAADWDELADATDEQARVRDKAGLQRDVRASGRDRAARGYAHDRDEAAIDRFIAGSDRDFAAGDRSDAGDDRRHARAARSRAAADRRRAVDDRDAAVANAAELSGEIVGLQEALKTRLAIGQAQGLLMARYHLNSDAAFRMLVKLSQQAHVKLRLLAERIVRDYEKELGTDPDQ